MSGFHWPSIIMAVRIDVRIHLRPAAHGNGPFPFIAIPHPRLVNSAQKDVSLTLVENKIDM